MSNEIASTACTSRVRRRTSAFVAARSPASRSGTLKTFVSAPTWTTGSATAREPSGCDGSSGLPKSAISCPRTGRRQQGERMTKLSQRLGRSRVLAFAAAVAIAALVSGAAAASNGKGAGNDRLQRINHIVVIYEENHSFDNLYGGWEGVRGVADADPAHTIQVDQFGNPYSCLFQNDANLTSPPL